MKRIFFALLSIALFSAPGLARADRHLELTLDVTPTAVLDDSFEFFASSRLAMDSYGADVRFEVADVKDALHILPFISYRYARESGYPEFADNGAMNTDIRVRDLTGGVRLRGWFLPWLGAFGQASAGATFIDMRGELDQLGNEGMKDTYAAKKTKWNLGASFGAEFRISPNYLKRKKIRNFNVGGEIGFGFIKRGRTNFKPSLSGGDEYSIEADRTVNFGDFDLSGITFNLGLTFSFF
jgi:hypothetical protein